MYHDELVETFTSLHVAESIVYERFRAVRFGNILGEVPLENRRLIELWSNIAPKQQYFHS